MNFKVVAPPDDVDEAGPPDRNVLGMDSSADVDLEGL